MKALLIGMFTVILSAGVAYGAVQYKGQKFDERMASDFTKLDTNGDGLISKQELDAHPDVVRHLNLYGKDSFREADFNKDGQLNRHEFIEFERYFPVE